MSEASNAVLVVLLVGHTLECVFSVCPDARLSVTHGRVLMHENQLRRLGDDVLATVVSRCSRHVLLFSDPGTLLRPAASRAVVTRPQQAKERARRSILSRFYQFDIIDTKTNV